MITDQLPGTLFLVWPPSNYFTNCLELGYQLKSRKSYCGAELALQYYHCLQYIMDSDSSTQATQVQDSPQASSLSYEVKQLPNKGI